jgi:FKBP-type peptidyl-prolyl cis-trans isomerase
MKEYWKRAGWILLTALFLLTSLGITVWAVWNDAHQKNTPDTSQTSQAANCQVSSVPTDKTLPTPDIYKPEGDVTALSTTDLQAGTGDAAKSGDCLNVKYYGTLATDGAMFDENFDKPTALTLKLGAGQVIPGWDQGLLGMKVGGTRRIVIPSDLGYGPTGSCKTPDPKDSSKCTEYSIPPNADLVFVVYLISK